MKKQKLSQSALSKKSGVSLGSVKRFETQYEISLLSLIKIAVALGCENIGIKVFHAKSIMKEIKSKTMVLSKYFG